MLNKIQIIGNLGADPELRYTQSGAAVANFNVATSRRYKDGAGEQQEETEWFRVVAWQRLAETCAQYLAKGRQVYVEGRMQTRTWEDQQGQKRYMTELVAQEVKFLGGRDGSGGGGGDGQGAPAGDSGMGSGGGSGGGDINPDDLPF